VDAGPDRTAEGIEAMQREGEPQRHPTGPAGELEAEIARVVRVIVGAQHVDVGAVLGVHFAGQVRLPVHQRARSGGREQPLVRIDDERVGPLDAREAFAQFR
jgi:hypothetical protein